MSKEHNMLDKSISIEGFVGQYIGQAKIVEARLLDVKTPKGSPVALFKTEDEESHTIPLINFASDGSYVVSRKPMDLSELRNVRTRPILTHIYQMLEEYGVEISDWDYVSQCVVGSLHENLDKATDLMWGTSHKNALDIHNKIVELETPVDNELQ